MSTPSLVGTYDRTMEQRNILTKEDLHWIDYRSLSDILATTPGVFIRDQNSVGQYNQLNIRGEDWRSIAITTNGRPSNDPASGIYNLFLFAPEYADRIEVITGPRAFLYGLNSTGGAINLVTKNYNSNRPFSKINYTESAYDYQYSDGTFSQNISRKINVTFGFQHQSTAGRFDNNAHTAWNWRGKIRYNVSRDFNIILSEYYTNSNTQLNGGANIFASGISRALDPLRATLKNLDAFEETNRHDIDLSFVGTLLGDTSNVSLLTLYYSESVRRYRDEENAAPLNGVFISSDHNSTWMGGLFTQNFDTDLQRFSLGSNIEIRQIKGSPNLGKQRNVIGNVWAKEEFLLGNNLTLAGYGRWDRYIGNSYLGAGTDASLQLDHWLSVFGGMSVSRRLPNYQELFWTDSTVSRVNPIVSEKHSQMELGIAFNLSEMGNARVTYFYRRVNDALRLRNFGTNAVFPGVLFSNSGTVTSNGIEASARLRFWVLTLEGTATYIVQRSHDSTLSEYPKLSANGGVYFWNTLLNNSLDIKVGFRGRYLSPSSGEEFNPEVVAYVPGTGPKLGQGASVDFVLIAQLGNAYVHFIWENLSNALYFTTPYYAALDRAIRFGVSWQFLD